MVTITVLSHPLKKRKFAFGGYELFLKLIIDLAQA